MSKDRPLLGHADDVVAVHRVELLLCRLQIVLDANVQVAILGRSDGPKP